MTNFIKQNWVKVVCVSTVLVVIIFVIVDLSRSQEITAYPVQCRNDLPTVYECKDPLPLNRTTYRVDKGRHEVVSWMPGFEDITLIDRYTNCIIIDLENWTCEYDDNSGKFGFHKGNYIISPSGYYGNIYVSKQRWEEWHNASF